MGALTAANWSKVWRKLSGCCASWCILSWLNLAGADYIWCNICRPNACPMSQRSSSLALFWQSGRRDGQIRTCQNRTNTYILDNHTIWMYTYHNSKMGSAPLGMYKNANMFDKIWNDRIWVFIPPYLMTSWYIMIHHATLCYIMFINVIL